MDGKKWDGERSTVHLHSESTRGRLISVGRNPAVINKGHVARATRPVCSWPRTKLLALGSGRFFGGLSLSSRGQSGCRQSTLAELNRISLSGLRFGLRRCLPRCRDLKYVLGLACRVLG